MFPTWRKTKRQKQQQRPQPRINCEKGQWRGDHDGEISDALLEINVSISRQSSNHDTTTVIDSTPPYFEAHEMILDSIGKVAYSSTTFLNLQYHWVSDTFSSQSSTSSTSSAPNSTLAHLKTPFPVIKSRTNICYCTEDDNYPGCVGDVDVIAHNSDDDDDGGGGGGDSRGNGCHEYSLPKVIVNNTLPCGGSLYMSRGNTVDRSNGVHGSSVGDSMIVHPPMNDQDIAERPVHDVTTAVANATAMMGGKNARKKELRSKLLCADEFGTRTVDDDNMPLVTSDKK